MPDECVAEVSEHNRVTLRASALRSAGVVAMESLEPNLMHCVSSFEQHGDLDQLRRDLRTAADPGAYDGMDLQSR